MIGAIIGAATGAAGSVLSGIKSAKEKKEYNNKLAEAKKSAEVGFDRYENLSPEGSVAYQAAVNKARKYFDDYVRQREGADAMMGTDSSSKARAEAASGMSSAVVDAAVQAQAHNDARAQQYQQSVDVLNGESRNGNLRQAQQNAMAGSNALNAGLSMSVADAQSH